MSVLDWNAYRQQVLSGVAALGKLSPDTVKGYAALGGAGQTASPTARATATELRTETK
jgi:hypothetical protein